MLGHGAIMQLSVDEKGLPILDQFSEEGFIDCVLKVENLRIEEKWLNFHMAASFEDQRVGVDVSVVRGIKAGFNANMELNKEHVYRQGVCLSRSGPESDRLVAAIAKLYGMETTIMKMVAQESYTAIALHQGTIDIESEPVKIKLFGNDSEAEDETRYYEIFFNLDLQNGFVFWNEKDQEYRYPLVNSLAKNVA
jgi:hypothetical protein